MSEQIYQHEVSDSGIGAMRPRASQYMGNHVCEAALRLDPFLLLFAHECMMKMYYLASAVLFRGRDLLGPHDAYLFFPLSDLYFSSRTPEEAALFN